jgi:hypothetical protein
MPQPTTPKPKRETPTKPEPMTSEKAVMIEKIAKMIGQLKPSSDALPPPTPPTPWSPQDPAIPKRRPMTVDEFHNWRKRTVAELIFLPAICPVRQCRRLRRCLIEEAICMDTHRERAGVRVNRMLGWDACSLFDEDEDD